MLCSKSISPVTLPFYKSFIQYHCFLCVYNGLDTNCTVQTNCLHNVKVTVHLLTDRIISFKVRTSDILLLAHSLRGLHRQDTSGCGKSLFNVSFILPAHIYSLPLKPKHVIMCAPVSISPVPSLSYYISRIKPRHCSHTAAPKMCYRIDSESTNSLHGTQPCL